MHIKQIIVDGFKSFKDATTPEPFDRHVNVIVGANGSGKTNLFHAIRFVVNDVFTHLRQEERQQLLHEGSGCPITTASVEVRSHSFLILWTDRDEVRLKRSVGLKKDDLFVDRKHTTRKEFTDLLEAAGISRSNPYYVVQQGKITSMANMRDPERLELLKEIGGVKVYEERRRESAKVFHETSTNRAQIEEKIQNLEKKLSELHEEREDLVKFQKFDKKRRCIEFTLYSNDLQQTEQELTQLDSESQEAIRSMECVASDVREVQNASKKLEKEVEMLTELKRHQLTTQNEADEQRAQYIKDHARLELDVKEIETEIERVDIWTAHDKQELAALESTIHRQKTELDKLNRELNRVISNEAAPMTRELEASTCRLQMLLQKQGRDGQFSSKEERDRWIMNEINELQTLWKEKTQSITSLKRHSSLKSKLLKKIDQKGHRLNQEGEKGKSEHGRCLQELEALRATRDEMQTLRRSQFKQDIDLEESIRHLKESHTKWEKQLEKSMPGDLKRSIGNCMRVVQEHGIEGVHGMVGDLLSCREQYFTAVEVAGRNQLFSIVIDRSDIAEQIISYLIRDKLGRVTFIPLDRIDTMETLDGLSCTHRAVPLVKFLKIEDGLAPVLNHVFGKTALVADLDVAAEISHQGFNCVTIEGDELRKNGSMKGGHYDPSRSRLRAIKEAIRCREELAEKEKKQIYIHHGLSDLDQRIAQCLAQIDDMSLTQKRHQTMLQQIRDESREVHRQKESVEREIAGLSTSAETIEISQEQINKQIESLQSEYGTALNARLTHEETKEIGCLNGRIKELKSAQHCIQERISGIEENRGRHQANLDRNLRLRQGELEEGMNQRERSRDTDDLKTKRRNLAVMKAAVDAAETEAKRLQTQLDQTHLRLTSARQKWISAQDSTAKERQRLDFEQSHLERFHLQRQRLQQRKDEAEKKIRDVGSVPEAIGEYTHRSYNELYAQLKKVKASLAKMTHVNKKAAEQYMDFMEQKQEMAQRHALLVQGEETIRSLMRFLDMQKDEAIERTFKGVAKNFRRIFTELVPEGRAELVMQKRVMEMDDGCDTESDEEIESQTIDGRRVSQSLLDRFSGVKVKVSFHQGTETTSLKQLSGGQKTLVALTLIFAIQKCDPAPFYLFDEIDAALDPLHRTAVAQMIKKQVTDTENPSQFILTTFHPQIVQEGVKLYSVAHQNRVSSVHVVNLSQALEFLKTHKNTEMLT